MKNIPKKIYLNDDDMEFTFPTVSFDREDGFQIEYILATPALKAAHDERQRQIEKEGYDANHDDEHVRGELALAAAIYALPDYLRNKRLDNDVPVLWPWGEKHWKPNQHNRKREITKAIALLIAEYERLDRMEETK